MHSILELFWQMKITKKKKSCQVKKSINERDNGNNNNNRQRNPSCRK